MNSSLYIFTKSLFRYYYSVFNVKKLLKYGFKWKLKSLDIKSLKKSDTLFVLGSGSSINNINEEGWEHIKSHNSIGLNYWPIHDFIPDIVMFEMPRGDRGKFFYDLLKIKKDLYKNTPFIFKGLYKNRKDFNGIKEVSKKFPLKLVENMYLGYELSLPGRNINEFEAGLEILFKRGFFNSNSNINTLAQYRGTVTCAISFAIKAGFKKIVLCGVDLNDTKYFYEQMSSYYTQKGIPVPPTGQVGSVHKTNIELNNVIPISKAIEIFDRFFNEKYGGKIYVSNSKSALYPNIAYYKIQSDEI